MMKDKANSSARSPIFICIQTFIYWHTDYMASFCQFQLTDWVIPQKTGGCVLVNSNGPIQI